jgi:hypothetical protein
MVKGARDGREVFAGWTPADAVRVTARLARSVMERIVP